MGNTPSGGCGGRHGHDGAIRGEHAVAARRKSSSLSASAHLHHTSASRKHSFAKTHRTASSLLPVRGGLTRHDSSCAPATLADDNRHGLSASNRSRPAVPDEQQGTEASRGSAAVEVLSAMTLDSFSSCPLVGPRNITSQFEQTSEVPRSPSPALCKDKDGAGGEDGPQRQSSSAAELARHDSFEGRLTHSIAIVEGWLTEQEKSVAVA